MDELWKAQLEGLGAFIRAQRQLANMSLREMASVTNLSNAYLSQIERGLHEPSVRVLKAVASALDLSAEALLTQAGLIGDADAGEQGAHTGTEATILADESLTESQKQALLSVYRSFLTQNS
jgi:transcriptional regulator with XRE-family HTH domain